MPRSIAVVEQLGNVGWKKMKGHGFRWMAESAFSSVKRGVPRIHILNEMQGTKSKNCSLKRQYTTCSLQ
jgi:hypothetical protein